MAALTWKNVNTLNAAPAALLAKSGTEAMNSAFANGASVLNNMAQQGRNAYAKSGRDNDALIQNELLKYKTLDGLDKGIQSGELSLKGLQERYGNNFNKGAAMSLIEGRDNAISKDTTDRFNFNKTINAQQDAPKINAINSAIQAANTPEEYALIKETIAASGLNDSTGAYKALDQAQYQSQNRANAATDRATRIADANTNRFRNTKEYNQRQKVQDNTLAAGQFVTDATANRTAAIEERKQQNAGIAENIPGYTVNGSGNLVLDPNLNSLDAVAARAQLAKLKRTHQFTEIPSDKKLQEDFNKLASESGMSPGLVNQTSQQLTSSLARGDTLSAQGKANIQASDEAFSADNAYRNEMADQEFQQAMADNPVNPAVTAKQAKIKPEDVISQINNTFGSEETVWDTRDDAGGADLLKYVKDDMNTGYTHLGKQVPYPGYVLQGALDATLKKDPNDDNWNSTATSMSPNEFKKNADRLMKIHLQDEDNKENRKKAEALRTKKRFVNLAARKANKAKSTKEQKANEKIFDRTMARNQR